MLESCELDKKSIYFYGVSGCGMMALAQWYLDQGVCVYGYDDYSMTEIDQRIKIVPLNEAEHIDIYCHTTALKKNHEFFQLEKKEKILIESRPDLLKKILKNYQAISITGTHGKTTTTTLVSYLLDSLNHPVNYFIGGKRLDTNRYGSFSKESKFLVLEADESTNDLGEYHSKIAIILNAHYDHLENFGSSINNYRDNMIRFASKAEWIVITDEAERVLNLGNVFPKEKFLKINELGLLFKDEFIEFQVPAQLPLPLMTPKSWQHIYAGLAVVYLLKLDLKKAIDSLRDFKGVQYRMERISKNNYIYRDYGHHPHELKNVFDCLKKTYPTKEKIIIFQPHKYSRTKTFFNDFINVLSDYDKVYLLKTHAAGELEDVDFSEKSLSMKIKNSTLLKSIDDLKIEANSDQIFLFQGAGGIMKECLEWMEKSLCNL